MFFEYLGEVIKQWITLLFGVLGSLPWWVRPLLSDQHKKKMDKVLNPNKIRILGIGCIIVAFIAANYFAWKDKQVQVGNLTDRIQALSKPNFSIIYYQYLSVELDSNKTLLFVNLGIKNIGVPSVATGWSLSVTSNSLNIDKIHPTIIPDGLTINSKDGKMVARFNKNNRLEDKTMAPIQQGSLIGGWLEFELSGINSNQLKEAKKTIYVQDINDKQYSLNIEFNKDNDFGKMYYPGSGDNPYSVSPALDKKSKD